MPHPWIPNSNPKIKEYMLRTIGVEKFDDLISEIPKEIRLSRPLNIGFDKPLSEYELLRFFDERLSKSRCFKKPPPFLGGTYCVHYVPSVVKYILMRGELYTTYTPYHAEIQQGVLQILFEYQSLIAELYGVDVVNASLYDGSTALAEAVRMASRVTRKMKIAIPSTINREHLEVLKTWCYGAGISITKISYDKERGFMDLENLKDKLSSRNYAAVVIENPSYLGFIEEWAKDIGEIAHDYKALFIVYSDPLSLAILKPPGEYGADIVVGDGQPLGLGLNYGGPTLGILGCRRDPKLVRQMPGRIVGMTTTVDGDERGFALIWQTREQHIRREKATSNITTNSALMAIAATVYLSLLGANGLKKLAKGIIARVNYAINKLSKIDKVEIPIFKAKFFKNVPMKFNGIEYREVHKKLLKKGIIGGKYIGSEFPELGEACLMCFTEVHSKSDIDMLASAIEEVIMS